MFDLLKRWRQARPIVRAEALVAVWECFSALLFVSAVIPVALSGPWPSVVFLAGLAVSAALGGVLVHRGRYGITVAVALRVAGWLVAVLPLANLPDLRLLVATLGFGLMAGGIRRATYRRVLRPRNPSPPAETQRAELLEHLGENAMVAGIVGGHVMLLFSVAFLRTASQVVFRAWWEIVPILAVLGTLVFTVAMKPLSQAVLDALGSGPSEDVEPLRLALRQARELPRRLSTVNFAVWWICTSIGVIYFQPANVPWRWVDAVSQAAFGWLFAWGVSFYQRGWHEDTLAPTVRLLREWTGEEAAHGRMTLRRRMLQEFGLPLLFTLALSLFASIGLYRTLGRSLSLEDDFSAITALGASFAMLVLAVGSVFQRAAKQLSEPLSKLAGAADQVAGGMLDAEVPEVQGPVEVVVLGKSLEDMRDTLARAIRELQEERASLETNVELRTAELSTALEELKQAQAALIQGERMALIGELVASVAHEIYNPLNAIGGSISALDRVSSEMEEMFAAYRIAEAEIADESRAALKSKREQLDIDGALEDLAGVVKVVRNATRRSVAIVSNLKSFARAPAAPIPSDLHTGLAETLSLLRHRLRQEGVELVERYGELPLVTCRAGEINQVFMNLLSNAIQAAVEHRGHGNGKIEVHTESLDDRVSIAISDNGAGVPDDLRARIFDPFFTTKTTEGTGLGLSISRDIVGRHGGELKVETASHMDSGARFVCVLPLKPPRSSRRGGPPAAPAA